MEIENDVNVIFNGSKEVIQIVNSESSLIRALGIPSHKCDLIGSEITLQNELGRGAYGRVFSIKFPHLNTGTRQFAVKRLELELQYDTLKSKRQVLEYLAKYQLTWDDIKPLQPKQSVIDTFNNAGMDKKVLVVMPSLPCLLHKNEEFIKFPQERSGRGNELVKITVPKGSYLCSENAYSEFVIGSLLGNLYDSKQSVNFFKIFSMFTCKNNDEKGLNLKYYQYVFMDKIDGTTMGIFGKKNEQQRLLKYNNICERLNTYFRGKVCNQMNIINGIYIQTIFAIICYQEKYKVSHNDLHTDNVFVEYVNDNTKFKGNYLKDADWYSYGIRGKRVYFPAIPVIVKIGDFGLSVKYSKPIVGDEHVFKTGYWQTDEATGAYDGNGAWIPNVFIPAYDGLFFTTAFAQLINDDLSRTVLGPLISRCLYYLCPRMDYDHPIKNQLFNTYVNPNNGRPFLQSLNDVSTPTEVFLGPIFDMFKNKPATGTIYSLGDLL